MSIVADWEYLVGYTLEMKDEVKINEGVIIIRRNEVK